MKKNLLLLLTLITVFYQASKAQAGLLLEPLVGMELSSSGELNENNVDITGTTVGGRLGFQNLGFMVGLDGRRMSWNLEADNSDVDYTFTQLSAFVGYDFPIMLRVWANYVFSLEGVNDDDSDTKLIEGSGTVIGIGYKVMPFVSLNLEMSNLKTDKLEVDPNETDYKSEYNTMMLSVSLPLSL